MIPNHKYTSREIVEAGWRWTTDSYGSVSDMSLQAAALVAIHQQLVSLNNKLDALGYDGIHQLIREGLKEVRSKRRARLKRRKK